MRWIGQNLKKHTQNIGGHVFQLNPRGQWEAMQDINEESEKNKKIEEEQIGRNYLRRRVLDRESWKALEYGLCPVNPEGH